MGGAGRGGCGRGVERGGREGREEKEGVVPCRKRCRGYGREGGGEGNWRWGWKRRERGNEGHMRMKTRENRKRTEERHH